MKSTVATKQEYLSFDAQEFFELLIKKIKAAKTHLYLEYYIFDNSNPAREVLRELIAAQKRGVKVVVVVDGYGTLFLHNPHLDRLEKAGADIYVYRPFFLNFLKIRFKKYRAIAASLKSIFFKANKRTHKKLFIADFKSFVIGSFNITKEHLQKKPFEFFDVFLRFKIEESPLKPEDFVDLNLKKSRIALYRKIESCTPLKIKLGTKDHFHHRKFLYQALDQSQKKLIIVTPYFMPTRKFIRKLKNALKRGVQVSFYLAHLGDSLLYNNMTLYMAKKLQQRGINVCLCEKFCHAKILIYDEKMLIGSSNLNFRSLYYDEELDYSATNPKLLSKTLKTLDEMPCYNRSLIQQSIGALRMQFIRVLFYFKWYL